jgi:hypothetical protein
MTSVQDIHIGQSLCVLCRQAASVGSHILDLNQNLLTVPGCRRPCARCFRSPYPSVWFHPTCYNVLQDSYEPSKKPTSEDLRRFADATRPVYKCQHEERGEIASVMEGLFSKYRSETMQDCFRQDLLGQLPLEISIMISELIAPCWYTIRLYKYIPLVY